MERIRKYAYTLVIILGGGAVSFLLLKYILPVVLPFLIAWALAFTVRPLAYKICGNGRGRGVTRAALTLLFTLALFTLIGIGAWRVITELWHLLEGLGEGGVAELLEGFRLDKLLPESLTETELGERLKSAFYELVLSFVTTLGGWVSSIVGSVPRVLLFILITVIASVYFALDLEEVNRGVRAILPPWASARLVEIKNGFLSFGVRYIRSYLLLMLVTFSVMLVGLFFLRAPYALLMSAVIAVLDLLPIIGVGTVLVPWSVGAFLSGNSFLGVGLIILLAAHEVVRQLIEPRILGKNLGVHPILTLILLYAGYSLFGFAGILLVPIGTVLLRIAFEKKNTAEVAEPASGE